MLIIYIFSWALGVHNDKIDSTVNNFIQFDKTDFFRWNKWT